MGGSNSDANDGDAVTYIRRRVWVRWPGGASSSFGPASAAMALMSPASSHFTAKAEIKKVSCNLGLMVDKPVTDDGAGPVYVRSLHPMCPLRDLVWPRNKISAEDVQGLSPVEVGMLLCQTTAKDMRKLTIVRDDVQVGYGGGTDDANGDRAPPAATGIARSKGGCYSTSEDTSKEEEDED